MGDIRILDESVSNIIAAGEVVENPTALIKELIENSLDAGSTEIKISVKNGGRDVEIIDNGKGMIKEDLLLCVERHATSKIQKKEDLFNLNTYGFRGEALSSICSVAKVKISSKKEIEKIGNSITISAGKITSLKEVEKNVGTEIEIKDLFFNTPARLKFLRKTGTEYSNIKDVIIQEALANEKVAFTLLIEGKESVKTTGSGIENAIVQIFSGNILKNLIKCKCGYIGNSSIARASKDSMFVFVNKRMVKSRTVENAVLDAYYTKLVKGKYPFAIIYLNLPPEEIDVNVHPSKKIVKFQNDTKVYDMVKEYINEKINKTDILTSRDVKVETFQPEEKLENKKLDIKDYIFTKPKVEVFEKKEKIEKKELEISEEKNHFFENSLKSKKSKLDVKIEIKPETKELEIEKIKKNEIKLISNSSFENYKIIGQFNNSYILVDNNKTLEIYDQHIVHERILYEKLRKEYLDKKLNKQSLLIPQRIVVDPREKHLIMENLKILDEFGFDVDEFERNEILIRTVPIFPFKESIESLFYSLLKEFKDNRDVDPRENIIISMSCKGAIKAGEKLSLEEMKILLKELHEIGEYTCPHGRPIILKLELNEIEKKIKRK
ncbi:MAG: DNA mismatch repair endonuclease MutL [Fusobacteriaceae bacterium]